MNGHAKETRWQITFSCAKGITQKPAPARSMPGEPVLFHLPVGQAGLLFSCSFRAVMLYGFRCKNRSSFSAVRIDILGKFSSGRVHLSKS
jgi:hypothetical protein